MYESFYGFDETPFRISAEENFLFSHSEYEKASAFMAYVLERGEGVFMLTGLPGSGKTTLCKDVISKCNPDKIVTINIITRQLQAEEVLRKIALELGLPAEQYDKTALLTSIRNQVADFHKKGKRTIIFLDEAQNLSTNDLDELKLLFNVQEGERYLLQIILVGHTSLRKTILEPGMEHIRQRIVAFCELDNMTADQAKVYFLHKLCQVGWEKDAVIDGSTYSLIYKATKGIPGLINHVISRLLLFMALENKSQLDNDDLLLVVQQLIDEDLLSLQDGESHDSIKERRLEDRESRHRDQHSRFLEGGAVVELGVGQQFGRPIERKQIFHDPLAELGSVSKEGAVERSDEDLGSILEDLDIPDTDLLGLDDHEPPHVPVRGMSQATRSPHEINTALSRPKAKHKVMDEKKSNSGHQWSGVWWMSDNTSNKLREGAIVVDDLPSIKGENCPEIFNASNPVRANWRNSNLSERGLKLFVIIVLLLTCIGLFALLLL